VGFLDGVPWALRGSGRMLDGCEVDLTCKTNARVGESLRSGSVSVQSKPHYTLHDVSLICSLPLNGQGLIWFLSERIVLVMGVDHATVCPLHACSARRASIGVSTVPAFESTKLSITRASIPEQK